MDAEEVVVDESEIKEGFEVEGEEPIIDDVLPEDDVVDPLADPLADSLADDVDDGSTGGDEDSDKDDFINRIYEEVYGDQDQY